MEILERMPFTAYKAAFEKLEKITDIAALSKEDRMKYDESIKIYQDINATLAFSKEEGRKEGRAEGEKIGMKRGRAEGMKEVAHNLKQAGIDITIISSTTGLSAEEIMEL